jgi:hypothetical protein
MDKYRLDLKSEDDFEKIIVRICQDILGIGITGFTKGVDGGSDGFFEGTSQNYPSKTNPWSGKFRIQAKHTTNSEASCSDNTFFGNQTSLIEKEIKKVKELKKSNEVDNYLCFTNRKLTGGKETEIRDCIKKKTQVAQVGIHGIEFIELNLTKKIIKDFGLNRSIIPFEFYEKDILEVIVLFGKESEKLASKNALKLDDFYRPSIDIKNRLNDLSEYYFKNVIQDESLKYFKQIEDFLIDPINAKFAKSYEKTAFELKQKIEVNRDEFDKFEKAFEYLYAFIFDETSKEIVEHRDLIYVFLHFMYYKCDIGRSR